MAHRSLEWLLPRVVIVGAGFGGLTAAKSLRRAPVHVTLIDRRNYHLFQPLLYQVATAALSPADIAAPIRGILRDQENCSVVLATVCGIDKQQQLVITDRGDFGYDHLIVSTGARHSYFGHDEWERHARGIKKIEDATELRRKILTAFERAETERDLEERARLLTFVIVGGGPTGVEIAGAVAELARRTLVRNFRNIDPRLARIVLVEAGPRLLSSFAPRLSERARRSLAALGVEVALDAAVTCCDACGVCLGERRIASRTVIWAAGVRASPAGKWLGAETDGAGRVLVQSDLSVPGCRNVYVIGDTAHLVGADGRTLPGVAPVAKQQAKYVAALITQRSRGGAPKPFRYRDPGSMATIGRNRAVAQIGALQLSGFAAWLLWALAHIYFLIGFRSRLAVALSWTWSYVTSQRDARLITNADNAKAPDMPLIGPAVAEPLAGTG
jgi:NADH:ubiquinone reductase (H+-translocating)